MSKKIIIIGSGFAGLSAACFMAKAGWSVTVLEKHATPGGRPRQLKDQGFTFDIGPSWYWMPDVFERFFSCFGKKVSDYYTLQRLNPAYRVYWQDDIMDVPDDFDALKRLFERTEPGSAAKLDAFIKEAGYKYKAGMQNLVYKPGKSPTEFIDWDVIRGIFRLDIFMSVKKHVAKYFKHPKLRQLLEFPVLFLGALPEKIPALYSLMNYAAIKGGTWYPKGGMYSIVDGMYHLAMELGVKFNFNEDVEEIIVEKKVAAKVTSTNPQFSSPRYWEVDAVIGTADYHHIETQLLPAVYQSYSNAYWDKRVMAPSCLLYYVGLSKKLPGISHHSLFFDAPFEEFGNDIYTTKQWPSNPLFYVSATSVTDNTVAPPGCENFFILIPVAAGLTGDNEALREKYFDMVITRLEKRLGQKVKDHIVFKKSFANSDFVLAYNAFKGNAYGLANTLLQTAVLKPSCRSKKVKNLFYAGHLTVPGPGVPPALISGEIAAKQVIKILG